MNSHFQFLLAILFIVVSSSLGSPYKSEITFSVCGSRLVDTMAMVCSSHYNSPLSKKSVNWNLEDPSDYTDDYSQNSINSGPFRWMDRNLNNFISKRHQGGIVEECCKRSCSISVMRSYCSK